MIKLEVNKLDLARITKKLEKIKSSAVSGKIHVKLEAYLHEYQGAVLSAMGTVSAGDVFAGGAVVGSKTVTLLNRSMNILWKPLSESTIERKQLHHPGNVTFWYETGDAKSSVKVWEERASSAMVDLYAGIKAGSPGYDHAIATEYGGKGNYPGRALFTLLGKMLIDRKEFIAEEIRKELMLDLQWGKG